jgi:hypothetical protein
VTAPAAGRPQRRLAYGALALTTVIFVAVGAKSAAPHGWGLSAGASDHPQSPPHVVTLGRRYAFPLRVSADGRYLVDRRGRPFMIVGESPQSLIGNLSVRDAAAYIANRRAAGFNTLWVNLLCTTYTGCRPDGTTADGIRPFLAEGDLARPNPAYFARAAAILRLARAAGIAVFLDPIETGGFLDVLTRNGVAKDRAYGRFVARRFRSFPNIVWLNGNDFQTWHSARDDAVVRAVASGIRSVDPSALQTLELDYPRSGSRDDARWTGLLHLDAAYTYYATYAQVLREYDRKPVMPVFLMEAGYEFEQNSWWISYGDPATLRRQEYWTMLSGAAGQFYGNHYTWSFDPGWKERLDTVASAQIGHLVNLLAPRRWYRLVPDQAHRIVTRGYGRLEPDSNVGSSDYVTTAATRDRTLAISYLPAGGTIHVDMALMQGAVRVHWYDPTDGKYSTVAGSPFANACSVDLTPPRRNAAGEPDWVLVLSSR